MDEKRYIKEELEQSGYSLSEQQIDQFLAFYQKMVEVNQVMNLTAITELDEVVRKHFLDSLSLTLVLNRIIDGSQKETRSETDLLQSEEKQVKEEPVRKQLISQIKSDGHLSRNIELGRSWQGRMLDLGTGAGFPGVPLKIFYPDWNITLMDSLNKRVGYLNSVIADLQLQNVEAVHGRAEEAARTKEYREQFDLCVSRAVANLATLSEYCLPFVKVGGYFVAYKTPDRKEEIKEYYGAIKKLGGYVQEVYTFQLEKQNREEEPLERCFVIIKKQKETPAVYPRKAGTPSKKPLK